MGAIMSEYLWQSAGESDTDTAIMAFMAGEDVLLDRVLFPHDIRATSAHVRGLQRIGILSESDALTLCGLLDELLQAFTRGEFTLDERYEDGHSAIEMYLTQRAGDLGARVHTGRSRNDQVAVATRLFMRQSLTGIFHSTVQIAQACLHRAEQHSHVPMPGYTHLQRAVPSSAGLWLGGFAEAFSDDLALLATTLDVLDASPLGTAAGYGVNLALDRDGVALDLGFARLQVNPLAVQNSRGKYELMALQAALHVMQDVRRLAWDLSLFTTVEFDFVELPPQYTTGSSIMPNKRNPDVVELLRGRAATLEGAVAEIQSLLSLPSGYQRDLQLTKGPLIRGLQVAAQSLAILPMLVHGLKLKEHRMRAAISADMFATDLALEQAAAGVPFREAYRNAKQQLSGMSAGDVDASLKQRVSPGGCGDLQVGRIRLRLDTLSGLLPKDETRR